MSTELFLALGILFATVAALVGNLVRMDVVALLVLVSVSVLGLIPAPRALSGFASPAVITVAGMFVISAGLARTGVAGLVGAGVLRWAGGHEVRLVVAVTVVSGLLSGFMNNVGVAAMMLPVVLGLSRRTSVAPSKLLIPMALGAQLGGFTTLIGTAPNLLASDALRDAGFAPFRLFSFAPMGLVLLAGGTVLVASVAPRLLPSREPAGGNGPVDRSGIRKEVDLRERLFFLTIPRRSPLDGRTLAESLIDAALGVHVLAIQREDRIRRAPGPDAVLRGGDRILVQGSPDRILEMRGRRHLLPLEQAAPPECLEAGGARMARVRVRAESDFVSKSAAEIDLRSRSGVLVLAVERAGIQRRTRFLDTPMRERDELLLLGPREALEALAEQGDVEVLEYLEPRAAAERFGLQDRLWSLRVTGDSVLTGRRLNETRLGDAVGLLVLAVMRDEHDEHKVWTVPGPDLVLESGDVLFVKASAADMAVLRALQRLEVDLDSDVGDDFLEGEDVGFAEAVLAPRSGLIGKTLRQANFQTRFGMHVVAIVREGETVHANLREEVLRFGDALVLYGPRRRQRVLAQEPDLILLQEPEGDGPEVALAWRSVAVTVLALAPVMAGWVPVAVGVIAGAAMMVVTGCLPVDDAYRAVDLSTVVLVAGMLSLGAALTETGAVGIMGDAVLSTMGALGPHAVLATLVLVTAVGGQIMPGSAVVVLMSPIAISGAELLGVSPHAMVMAIAIAGTSLASPVSQPAHALVMAPAGYRMGDYLRLGIPMTVLVLTLTVLFAPVFMPF